MPKISIPKAADIPTPQKFVDHFVVNMECLVCKRPIKAYEHLRNHYMKHHYKSPVYWKLYYWPKATVSFSYDSWFPSWQFQRNFTRKAELNFARNSLRKLGYATAVETVQKET